MAVSFPFGALSFRFLGDLRQKTRQRTRMRLEYNYINWPRIQKQLDEVKWMSAESRESQAVKDSKAAICLHYSYRNQNADLARNHKAQGDRHDRDRDREPAWANSQGDAPSLEEISKASFAHKATMEAAAIDLRFDINSHDPLREAQELLQELRTGATVLRREWNPPAPSQDPLEGIVYEQDVPYQPSAPYQPYQPSVPYQPQVPRGPRRSAEHAFASAFKHTGLRTLLHWEADIAFQKA
eukprot:g33570.t1